MGVHQQWVKPHLHEDRSTFSVALVHSIFPARRQFALENDSFHPSSQQRVDFRTVAVLLPGSGRLAHSFINTTYIYTYCTHIYVVVDLSSTVSRAQVSGLLFGDAFRLVGHNSIPGRQRQLPFGFPNHKLQRRRGDAQAAGLSPRRAIGRVARGQRSVWRDRMLAHSWKLDLAAMAALQSCCGAASARARGLSRARRAVVLLGGELVRARRAGDEAAGRYRSASRPLASGRKPIGCLYTDSREETFLAF